MAELSLLDQLTAETRSELDTLERDVPDIERQLRAAQAAVDAEQEGETRNAEPDAETRERVELRRRCSLGRYLVAALGRRQIDGAEAELREAAGFTEPNIIPFELFEPTEHREDRAVTAAPASGTGVNLQPLVPQVFAPSIAPKLMVDMPQVPSGAFSTARVSAGTDPADAVAKSAAVPEVASTWTVKTTTPHRVGASLRLTLEDIATVGHAGFESMLRQHLSLVVSDEVDDQMINGDGQNDDISGFFQQLTDPSAPATGVESWMRFLAIQSGQVDGLWATELEHVGLTVGVDTYRLAAATFQGSDSEESAASYLKRMGAGDSAFFTNSRMPAPASNVQQGIACRKGRTMMPSPMRVATCPTWGFFSVDDIYSGAAKGERVFTINTLIGDLILLQPDAFSQVAFRVST